MFLVRGRSNTANHSPSPSTMDRNQSSTIAITDLDADSFDHCFRFLSIQDIGSVSMSCKYLRQVAYSDSIWQRLFRERWQHVVPPCSLVASGGARQEYLARLTAIQQFKFEDPLFAYFSTQGKPLGPMLLDRDDIYISRGSSLQIMKIANLFNGSGSPTPLSDHNARITCMRLFPLHDTSFFRSERQRTDNFLVTSSFDHSIRLWWKGSCQRCFRGHNGPVSTLSDKLVGDGSCKLLASGGEDRTVHLWSLSSSGKRGKCALKATLHGHEKPIKLISVAGHKTSLLVSIARDSKVMVWDVTASSTVRSSCRVGSTSLSGSPVNMKCHESLLYVAAGSSVVAIDLRTMQKVLTAAAYQPLIYSFEMIPSKSLICTGGSGSAMLWDVRRNQDSSKAVPIAELDGHKGAVRFLHMDPYKIVTAAAEDTFVNIWEIDSGAQANSLSCWFPESPESSTKFSALAVDGSRIVTACYSEDVGLVQCRDYTDASCPIIKRDEIRSKFWDPWCYGDNDGSDSDL